MGWRYEGMYSITPYNGLHCNAYHCSIDLGFGEIDWIHGTCSQLIRGEMSSILLVRNNYYNSVYNIQTSKVKRQMLWKMSRYDPDKNICYKRLDWAHVNFIIIVKYT